MAYENGILLAQKVSSFQCVTKKVGRGVVKCAVVQFGLDHRALHIKSCTPTWLGRTGRGIFFFQHLLHKMILANQSGKSVQERRVIHEYLELSGGKNWQLTTTKFGQQQTQDFLDQWKYEEKTFFGWERLQWFPCLKINMAQLEFWLNKLTGL